jgi:alkylation response protein AidB-like acyl-CoA dehydrogenase
VTPFLGTVLAAGALQAAGSDEQKARWLPGLASGELRGALGASGQLVPDAAGADVVVLVDVAARTAAVRDGAVVEAVDAIDPTRRFGRINAANGPGDPLPGDAGAAIDLALVAIAADLVGICQRALDMTVEYVKERKQFGVAVGTFQAVQHKAAQMLLDTEGARSSTLFAAWTADAEPDRLPMAAAMAKAWSSDAGRSTTAAAIQLHGGIGFTWEADVHWLFKRAQLDAALLGGGATHRARVAALASGRAEAVPA